MTDLESYSYTLREAQAKVIQLALIKYNDYLINEFDKLAFSKEVSNFIKEAAHKQYQELSHDATQLHLDLATAFPSLRQGGGPTPS